MCKKGQEFRPITYNDFLLDPVDNAHCFRFMDQGGKVATQTGQFVNFTHNLFLRQESHFLI